LCNKRLIQITYLLINEDGEQWKTHTSNTAACKHGRENVEVQSVIVYNKTSIFRGPSSETTVIDYKRYAYDNDDVETLVG